MNLSFALPPCRSSFTQYIPQIKFTELSSLPAEKIAEIKRKGSVVIRDVVDDSEATAWKNSLEEFVKTNPDVEGKPLSLQTITVSDVILGFPAGNKQFFQL